MKHPVFNALLAAVLFTTGCVTATADASLADQAQTFVKSEWNSICRCADKGTALLDEWFTLPEHTWSPFAKDKKSQQKAMESHVRKARELLLSTNSKKLLDKIERLNDKISGHTAQIEKLREESIVNPERTEKLEGKIAQLKQERDLLEESRADLFAALADDLRSIGLDLNGGQLQTFFAGINANTIVDNAVVAKNIAIVTEKLRMLMDTKDIATAKRYYGMYIEMINIQIECFRQYESLSSTKWAPGVKDIRKSSSENIARAQRFLREPGCTEAQKAIFLNNIRVSRQVVEAADLYVKMLDDQAATVAKKRKEAELMLNAAVSTYETVRVVGDLASIMDDSRASFDAILSIEIPSLAVFDDTGVQEQFAAITRQLSSSGK